MKQALLIIDIQNDYFEGGNYPLWNAENTLNNICEATKKAGDKDIPIILIQHVADSSAGIAPFFNEGTEGVNIHNKLLSTVQNPHIVTKSFADSFYHTDLENVLERLKVDELLVCGMMTQNCVTHTAISKSADKYSVKILADCCTTVDESIHMIALHAVSTRIVLSDGNTEL